MNKKQNLLKALLNTVGQNKVCDSLAGINKAFDILEKAQKKEHQQELNAQHERANDHCASLIADIHSKLKKIQILADQEQALETDISLQELIKEIKGN